MKLIVGLGNPGSQYTGTRHNVGFEVLDTLVSGPGGGKYQRKFEGDLAEAWLGLDKVLYLKPLTFMNLSGRAVRAALDFHKLTPGDLLVVCDDINLPLGQLRLRPTGSAGGHNGLKDIERQLGTQTYARLRIGVGGPNREELIDHVLGKFKPSERNVVDDANIRAAQAVVCWMNEGTEVAMNRFNAPEKEPKPKKPRPEKKQDPGAKDAPVPTPPEGDNLRGTADQG